MANILIVDDDVNLGLALRMTLTQEGHDCRLAETGEKAWAQLQQQEPDLALLDLQLPDISGLQLLERMRQRKLQTPVVIMTAFGTVTSAVAAMKHGAEDFIEKPLSIHEVCQLVGRLLRSGDLARELEQIPAAENGAACELIGKCAQIVEARRLAERIGSLPSRPGMGLTTTLILGETGTGKEMIARHIHANSPAPQAPFVHVNCTAIPESLFETELFGHERGVFTGAGARRHGLFKSADGGTLFLDEVSEMPPQMQVKLLVAIETGRFRQVGSTREQSVEARVVAATNCNIEEKVSTGQVRLDLFHRLKMFQINLPPLRDRGEDLFLLTDHFLRHFAQRLQKQSPRLSPRALEIMRRYGWPGNVRELGHTLLSAMAVSDAEVIEPELLGIEPGTSQASIETPAATGFDFSKGAVPLESVERKLLQAALRHADGNITEAARLVGMARGTFRYRIEKLRLI